MRLAVPRIARGGMREPGVVYLEVTTSGWQAHEIHEALFVGGRVGVAGRIALEEWIDEGGQRRSRYEVMADQLELLDPPPGGAAAGARPPPVPRPAEVGPRGRWARPPAPSLRRAPLRTWPRGCPRGIAADRRLRQRRRRPDRPARVLVSLPHEDFVYLGDTARFPYGDRTPAELEAFALEIADDLLADGAKLLVVACNSATSAALPDLRETYGRRLPVVAVVRPESRLAAAGHPERPDRPARHGGDRRERRLRARARASRPDGDAARRSPVPSWPR